MLQQAAGPLAMSLSLAMDETSCLNSRKLLPHPFCLRHIFLVQDLGASPNVMSELPAGQIDEVRMYPLHLAVQAKNNACVSLLINHKSVSALSRLDFGGVVHTSFACGKPKLVCRFVLTCRIRLARLRCMLLLVYYFAGRCRIQLV